ncbi:hypothetical protein GRI89_00550 [Altererythrobacter salegens]|uniref:Uncharacterized protein n=1 Tax=Croceibacterium salegens TaxID=1737568 RepID=A0A6I4SQE2_9SPHN|nr:hypothetical protein [Croceibacterium salegens]MXO58034.1 hypothetical protein [Croceibacterium salegens]
MTEQSRLRRIGWLAALSICTLLYIGLHLKVNAVRSDVVRAERQIVALESQKLLLQTEFETRASQEQLASWNRVEFGYVAPGVGQFVTDERKLNDFGSPPSAGAPVPIRVASAASGEDAPPYPKLVSPLTGKPVDKRLLDTGAAREAMVASNDGGIRIPLNAVAGGLGE